MTRLFITGISGLLGLNMALQLRDRYTISGGYHSHAVDPEGIEAIYSDLTSYSSTRALVSAFKPDVVIHTAAYTDVEGCESNPIMARILNVDSAANISAATAEIGAKLVHFSTDHLFDGIGPWRTELDTPHPLNTYALTKWEGEQAVIRNCPDALILRTNFFGWGSPIKNSFSDWVLAGLREGRRLPMFSDSFFSPVLVNDLTEIVIALIEHHAIGTYNVPGHDRLSKHSFALKLADTFGYSTANVDKVLLSNHQDTVKRPNDMSLSSSKLESTLGRPTPTIVEGLSRLKLLEEQGWQKRLANSVRCPKLG